MRYALMVCREISTEERARAETSADHQKTIRVDVSIRSTTQTARSQPMSTYLFTFRTPAEYAPSPDTFAAWAAWQMQLGVRLKDRGNPAFAAAALGNCAPSTTLGGYCLVRAGSLGDALAMAQDCPILSHAGGVEVGELTNHDEKFDEWLGRQA
jgi:hypothetical protein